MVSNGCGNISAKSNGDNAPLSSSVIGNAFESQSSLSTTSLGSRSMSGSLLILGGLIRLSLALARIFIQRERGMLAHVTLTDT